MRLKNAAGEKREVVFHEFFPTNRKRVQRLLEFIADNTEKRDKYYEIISQYVIRRYMATDYEIAVLTAEKAEKRNRLHALRHRQTSCSKPRWTDPRSNPEYQALEHEAELVKRRLKEITAELQGARIRKQKLLQNVHDLTEVKPW